MMLYSALPVGKENRIPRKEITARTGIDKRDIEKLVFCLIHDYGVPVVAIKSNPSGYYIPRNAEELADGLEAYKKQIVTSQQRVRDLENIELRGDGDYSFVFKRQEGELV
ncbi:hypothetical protein ACLN19_01725 [Streptococcus sp. zg-JUN1979]